MTNAAWKDDRLAALEAEAKERRENRLRLFVPYPKQREFFDLGTSKRERLLMAGNQTGKTYAGAAELAMHLTGLYPDWWKGRRFDQPIRAWACGESAVAVRDIQQRLLLGEPGVESALGTGMLPHHVIADKPTLARGASDAVDTVQVRHISGGISTLTFKSYEMGRTKFQGQTLHAVWLDEEPDLDIYSEALTRLTATRGLLFMTFTPLKGMSDVVMRFLNEPSPDRAVVSMTIEDALHIPADERARIIAGYPEFEREARARGVPMLGSGRIFQTSEADIIETLPISSVPFHWFKLWGIDPGIGHPFAAVLIAWDRDADVIHVLHTIKMKDAIPREHAVPMKAVGAAVPVAWPHDAGNREKGSGRTLAEAYKAEGLRMLGTHATHPIGGYDTEAGVLEMRERFMSGRLKIASHLDDLLGEYRLYHRKDGMIVKQNDDLLSALRIAVMQKRSAAQEALGSKFSRGSGSQFAKGIDFDVLEPSRDRHAARGTEFDVFPP